jgi:ATP-dependent DNA helicase PIF1
VFLNIKHQLLILEFLHNSAILILKNNTVNALNSLLLASMPRRQITSTSINHYKDETGASSYPIKFLYTVNLTTLLPYQLYLKVGCPIIFLYNINPSNSLCNKTCLVVLSITPRLLRYSILKSQYHSTIIQLPYIPLHTLSSTDSIKFICYQFPVKLTFTIIINKA